MSGRPWIEHDGSGCPVPKGTMVEVMRRDGSAEVISAMSNAYVACVRVSRNYEIRWPCNWKWESAPPRHIIAYRLSDTDDKAKREARMESFRKMAQPNDYDVRPVKAPQKVGAGQ